uniref:Sideroflexin 4 n=1 Tax=Pipistrellus kuhlii TaxID=59472 RepID=A0A7J7VCK5_PIPKU|nr:sideroflexin 4 [Pipistrellus kuhlii]
MVFLSLVQVKSLKSIILPQLSFCTYSTAFNLINGNKSYHRGLYETVLLATGVIASTAFFGILPRLLLMKNTVKNVFLRETLPAAILTQVSALSVATSRSLEPLRGIEVMDKEGNVIGYSRRAGTKAVRDTTISRVVLFGTSAFIPEVFSQFFKKTPLFVRYPQSLWTLKLSCTILVMGLMVPVSFSMFPQIQRSMGKYPRVRINNNHSIYSTALKSSAVSSNRKFSLQQKRQNCSITEGCRGAFAGFCSENLPLKVSVSTPEPGLWESPAVSAQTGWLPTMCAKTEWRLVMPGLPAWMGEEMPPHGDCRGAG